MAIAAAFFLAFAALIAFVCYGLLTRPSMRRTGAAGTAARKSTAALAAASVGLVVSRRSSWRRFQASIP
jgi:hypothetical protein